MAKDRAFSKAVEENISSQFSTRKSPKKTA